MIESVEALRRMVAPGGALAFTFFDPRFDRSLSDSRLPRGSTALRNLGPRGQLEMVKRARWFTVIDDTLYVEPDDALHHQTRAGRPHESYCSFFTADFMKSLFAGATIREPVCREWQHCCIIKN